jgi:hypothetical protein
MTGHEVILLAVFSLAVLVVARDLYELFTKRHKD